MGGQNGADHDIAIAHKDYAVCGGGEILAERLGLCFDAPVYTGFLNPKNRSRELRADVRDLFGHGLVGKFIKRGGLTRQMAYRILWKHPPELYDYDIVIQSGMEPLWFQPRDIQTTIAYVHSTPRMQYDLAPYLSTTPGSIRGWVGTTIAEVYNDYVRNYFLATKHYPDVYVANSDLVARRLERYWRVNPERIEVVYPPIAVEKYGPENATRHEDDFYLSINRLDEWKGIDEIVDAFADLDQDLLVAGKGPCETELRKQAKDVENIEFLGFVSADEKRRLLAAAKAVVYNPLNEDFGMVPVESLASGTPVVSVRDGFQRWQLEDGTSAVMYDRDLRDRDQTVRNLKAAIHRFEGEAVDATPEELEKVAKPYAVDRFNREMHEVVSAAAIKGPFDRPDIAQRFEAAEQASDALAVADGGLDS